MTSNKNILFISNYTLTNLYIEIAKKLENANYTVYWICTALEWEATIKAHFPAERVIKLDRSLRDKPSSLMRPKIPLNEISYIDREVSAWKPAQAEAYMLNTHEVIKSLLVDKQIIAAFSENTWAHEIITAMLCEKDLDVQARHFSPHPLRIPDRRFSFFSNFLLNKMMPTGCEGGTLTATDLFTKRTDITDHDTRIVARKKRTLVQSSLRLLNLILRWRNDGTDPTWRGSSRSYVVSRVTRRWACTLGYRMLQPLNTEKFTQLAQSKQVYIYAFHKVPETAINNKGRFYEDQAARILDLWRKLPTGSVLAIKEHRVSIGDRGWFYFRKLLRLPNVVLLDHRIESTVIREHASACFTISGTMAYEFALDGKPGVTFAPTFFNQLQYSFNITTTHFTDGHTLDKILADNTSDGLDPEAYAAHLAVHSHEGEVNEPAIEPRVLSEDNIALLAKAAITTLVQLHPAPKTAKACHD